ncbi:MAG: ribosome silencing factor [Pseudomonadota bacterium]
MLEVIQDTLEDAKAEDITIIDLENKTSIGDTMIIASGRSNRHVGAIAEQLVRNLKKVGFGKAHVEGLSSCDWVLIDAGDVIVHVFRPEVREFYNLEKIWSSIHPEAMSATDPSAE